MPSLRRVSRLVSLAHDLLLDLRCLDDIHRSLYIALQLLRLHTLLDIPLLVRRPFAICAFIWRVQRLEPRSGLGFEFTVDVVDCFGLAQGSVVTSILVLAACAKIKVERSCLLVKAVIFYHVFELSSRA